MPDKIDYTDDQEDYGKDCDERDHPERSAPGTHGFVSAYGIGFSLFWSCLGKIRIGALCLFHRSCPVG